MAKSTTTNKSENSLVNQKYRKGLVYLRMKGLDQNRQKEFLDNLQKRNSQNLLKEQENKM